MEDAQEGMHMDRAKALDILSTFMDSFDPAAKENILDGVVSFTDDRQLYAYIRGFISSRKILANKELSDRVEVFIKEIDSGLEDIGAGPPASEANKYCSTLHVLDELHKDEELISAINSIFPEFDNNTDEGWSLITSIAIHIYRLRSSEAAKRKKTQKAMFYKLEALHMPYLKSLPSPNYSMFMKSSSANHYKKSHSEDESSKQIY